MHIYIYIWSFKIYMIMINHIYDKSNTCMQSYDHITLDKSGLKNLT